MKDSKLILNLMMAHHTLLEVLLTVFKDSLNQDTDSIKDSLGRFRWEFEKHMFIEEQVLFNFFSRMKSETARAIPQLITEHDNMSDILNEFKKDLLSEKKIDLSEFQNLLKRHRTVEENLLYPEMDKELNEEQKEIIVSRINEIPLKES